MFSTHFQAVKSAVNVGNEGPWYRRALLAACGAFGLLALASKDLPFSPACPFHVATGLWCPGCGLTRACLKLLQLDINGALRMNIFAPAFVAMLLWATAAYVFPPKIPRPTTLPGWVWRTVLVAALLFGLARNLPGLWWMRPL